MAAEDREYPLAKLITALGDELREAQRIAAADDKPDLLKLKDCSVEMGIDWEKKVDGGIEFWVVKLGGGVTKTNTQTISVSLEPLSPDLVLALTE